MIFNSDPLPLHASGSSAISGPAIPLRRHAIACAERPPSKASGCKGQHWYAGSTNSHLVTLDVSLTITHLIPDHLRREATNAAAGLSNALADTLNAEYVPLFLCHQTCVHESNPSFQSQRLTSLPKPKRCGERSEKATGRRGSVRQTNEAVAGACGRFKWGTEGESCSIEMLFCGQLITCVMCL